MSAQLSQPPPPGDALIVADSSGRLQRVPYAPTGNDRQALERQRARETRRQSLEDLLSGLQAAAAGLLALERDNAPVSTGRPTPHYHEMLRALADHDVRHVVIGGVAGRVHGDPGVTFDLDIAPDPDPANLQRLADALRHMDALVRPPDAEPVAFELDGGTIAQFTTLATRTRFGDLDVVVRPDGIPGGYQQLQANAHTRDAFGVTVQIADVEDIIASRRASAQLTGQTRYQLLADRLDQLSEDRRSEDMPRRRPPPQRGGPEL